MSQTPSILFTATAAMASTPANDEICDKEAEKVAQNVRCMNHV
jgi:hypothetical protein